MIWFAFWCACAYILCKLCLFYFGPGRGFGRIQAKRGFREMICTGEPFALIVAIVLSVSVISFGKWYQRQWAERQVAHATRCFGQLAAVNVLPRYRARFSETAVWESEESTKSLAEDAGKHLNYSMQKVDSDLATSKAQYAKLFEGMVGTPNRAKIDSQFDAVSHCITDDFD